MIRTKNTKIKVAKDGKIFADKTVIGDKRGQKEVGPIATWGYIYSKKGGKR